MVTAVLQPLALGFSSRKVANCKSLAIEHSFQAKTSKSVVAL